MSEELMDVINELIAEYTKELSDLSAQKTTIETKAIKARKRLRILTAVKFEQRFNDDVVVPLVSALRLLEAQIKEIVTTSSFKKRTLVGLLEKRVMLEA